MTTDNFSLISINGRYVYGYLCLINALTYTRSPQLPEALEDLFHEFVESDKLDDWHSKVEEILPSFIQEVEETSNDFLLSNVVQEVKDYYKSLPDFIVDIIENLLWLGISNLYVAFNSENSMKYLKIILQTMDNQSIQLPDFEMVKNCSIEKQGGWGENDNLNNYLKR